jgi:uncharacterized membrane protein YraQ (UPF0718 family)
MEQVMELLNAFRGSVIGIFWFFVISVVVASGINSLKLYQRVVHFFERAGAWSVIGALLLGLVSPL